MTEVRLLGPRARKRMFRVQAASARIASRSSTLQRRESPFVGAELVYNRLSGQLPGGCQCGGASSPRWTWSPTLLLVACGVHQFEHHDHRGEARLTTTTAPLDNDDVRTRRGFHASASSHRSSVYDVRNPTDEYAESASPWCNRSPRTGGPDRRLHRCQGRMQILAPTAGPVPPPSAPTVRARSPPTHRAARPHGLRHHARYRRTGRRRQTSACAGCLYAQRPTVHRGRRAGAPSTTRVPRLPAPAPTPESRPTRSATGSSVPGPRASRAPAPAREASTRPTVRDVPPATAANDSSYIETCTLPNSQHSLCTAHWTLRGRLRHSLSEVRRVVLGPTLCDRSSHDDDSGPPDSTDEEDLGLVATGTLRVDSRNPRRRPIRWVHRTRRKSREESEPRRSRKATMSRRSDCSGRCRRRTLRHRVFVVTLGFAVIVAVAVEGHSEPRDPERDAHEPGPELRRHRHACQRHRRRAQRRDRRHRYRRSGNSAMQLAMTVQACRSSRAPRCPSSSSTERPT